MEVEKTIETLYGKFLLRPYCDDDEQNVLDLWENAFGKKLPIETWRWKFHNNPFGRQIMLCLTENGLPIAMYAGIPYLSIWNGQEIRMTQLIDNMSHPRFRQVTNGRKGLFIQTAEHFFEVYGGLHASVFHYGFPGIKHFRLGNLFLSYSMIADGGIYLTAETQRLKNGLLPGFGHVNRVTKVTNDFDHLWDIAKVHYPLSIKRDSQFIRWRFFEHPFCKYLIYSYKNWKGDMFAYAVITINGNIATIVDIFTVPGKFAIQKLMLKIGRELHKTGITTMQIWMPKKHFISECLIQLGFIINHEPLGIIPTGKTLYEKLDIDFAINNTFYTMADGDLF